MSYTELFRLDRIPVLQQRMFTEAAAARDCVRGDLVIGHDRETGLVTNRAFRPELMNYDADYQNEQGHSTAFQAHLAQVAGFVATHFAGKKLIEVGCGKAIFLTQLRAAGFDVTGVDPAYTGDDPTIIREYFRPGLQIRGDAIVLRHVLEHIPNPVQFLRELGEANGGQGLIYIEVPCFDWICERRAWSDITYEHVNYFRLGDFHRMFGRVLESGRIFHGQYLYVVADLATVQEPRAAADDPLRFPPDFLRSIADFTRVLGSRTDFAVWGAASKGVMFALHMERAGVTVPHIADINRAKQGRFLAGTGVRVSSPSEVMAALPEGADVIVMNGNYLEEIRSTTGNRYRYSVLNE